MDIYKLLKINNYIKSHRLKFLGLWFLSVFDKRYLSVQLDPVLACNLKCQMCYFSDPDYIRNKPKGMFKVEELPAIAKAFFNNALRLQIGCGTEPTLFKGNEQLIKLAKQYRVPHISMITNGNLLTKEDVNDFANAGLNEFIMSMHGVEKDTYEAFMTNGNYEIFVEVLNQISIAKESYPNLRLRINYTFNEDNFFELRNFFKFFGHLKIDILQLRPIDKIGNTSYNNFSLKKIEKDYTEIIEQIKKEAKIRNITIMCPERIFRDEKISLIVETSNNSSYLLPYTYCYVSPKYFWKDDFDWSNETFKDWQQKNNWNKTIFKNIFVSRKNLEIPNRNMLNYDVQIN